MFRNISSSIPCELSCSILYELQGDQFVESNFDKILPCSNDYSLKDLLSAGVKVSPVDPTVVHDSECTSAVARDFVENFVEPSNDAQ